MCQKMNDYQSTQLKITRKYYYCITKGVLLKQLIENVQNSFVLCNRDKNRTSLFANRSDVYKNYQFFNRKKCEAVK